MVRYIPSSSWRPAKITLCLDAGMPVLSAMRFFTYRTVSWTLTSKVIVVPVAVLTNICMCGGPPRKGRATGDGGIVEVVGVGTENLDFSGVTSICSPPTASQPVTCDSTE